MKTFHILRNYYCQTDDRQYILTKALKVEEGKNKGAEYMRTLGYYGSLDNVFKAVYDELVREDLPGYAKCLGDALEVVKKAREEVAEAIDKAVGWDKNALNKPEVRNVRTA